MYLGSQNPADGDTLDPLPTYSPAYAPSPDGTTITGGTGTVTTVDGVWSFGAPYSGGGLEFNAERHPRISVGASGIGYGAGGATPVSTIEVNSYEQLYALGAGGIGNNTRFR
jgi:hypothetical protein